MLRELRPGCRFAVYALLHLPRERSLNDIVEQSIPPAYAHPTKSGNFALVLVSGVC